ncbi:HAD family hydrolase [Streptomyces sp. NPDC059193]|uniref:HAD family hydrolase n=1 Tax=Streptomyces sp. NPDC059193 TaxID=3346763 RepID=UPI0036A62A89
MGSPALLRRHGVDLTEDAQGWTDRLRADGETVSCLAHDEDLIGMLGVSDAVRVGAETVVQQLRDLGVSRLILLTGDAQETAQVVADTLGITEVHTHALLEASPWAGTPLTSHWRPPTSHSPATTCTRSPPSWN